MMNCSSNPFKLNVECLRGSPHRSEIAPSPRLSWAASSAGTNRITARATAFTTLAPIYSGPAPAQPRFAISCGSLPIIGSRSGVENISWKRELDLSTTLSWWAPSPVACRSKSAAAPGRRRDVARGRPKTDPPGVLSAARRGGAGYRSHPYAQTPPPPGFLFVWEFFIRPTAPSGPSTIHLKLKSCLIDGEVVYCDENGAAAFQSLRHRRNERLPLRLRSSGAERYRPSPRADRSAQSDAGQHPAQEPQRRLNEHLRSSQASRAGRLPCDALEACPCLPNGTFR
jgi:hypothetical protein